MLVFLNGKFVPEAKAVVSVFDRGFLFGDALFETILVIRGQPFRWTEHLRRFQKGVDFLRLDLPYSLEELRTFANQLIVRNRMPYALLRLTLSRGITAPGYSPKNARSPAVVMTLRPSPPLTLRQPPLWRVITSSVRLPANNPLALFKTGNKLHQVLARAEADAAGADDALLLNTNGHLAEGTSSNIFWIKNNVVWTPALPVGPLPGITRALVLDLCQKMKIPARETEARPAVLHQADGVFLTMTSPGIVEVKSVDGKKTRCSPLTRQLRTAYYALLRQLQK
jgi:aminodeoxychorismate lyase